MAKKIIRTAKLISKPKEGENKIIRTAKPVSKPKDGSNVVRTAKLVSRPNINNLDIPQAKTVTGTIPRAMPITTGIPKGIPVNDISHPKPLTAIVSREPLLGKNSNARPLGGVSNRMDNKYSKISSDSTVIPKQTIHEKLTDSKAIFKVKEKDLAKVADKNDLNKTQMIDKGLIQATEEELKKQLRIYSEICDTIGSDDWDEESFMNSLMMLVKILGYDALSFFLVDKEAGEFQTIAHKGYEVEPDISLIETFKESITENSINWENLINPNNDSLKNFIYKGDVEHIGFVPVKSSNKIHGFFIIVSNKDRKISPIASSLLEVLGGRVGLVLETMF